MGALPSIVVVQNGAQLGDALCQLSGFRAMRQAWPSHRLILLAARKTVFADLLAPAQVGVFDEVVSPTTLGEDPVRLTAYLRDLGRVSAVFDTRSNLKAVRTWLAATTVGVPVYCGNNGGYVLRRGIPGVFQRRPAANSQRIHRMVELAAGRSLPCDASLPISAEAWRQARALLPEGDGPYLGIMPAGAWTTKSWPLDRHVRLAALAGELGLRPVFVLGPHETADVGAVRRAAGQALVIEPSLCNGDPAAFFWLTHAVIARFAVCVATEGGLGHLAASHGARLVTLSARADFPRWLPATPYWRSVRAEDLGGARMADIPAEAALAAVADLLHGIEPDHLAADRAAPADPAPSRAPASSRAA